MGSPGPELGRRSTDRIPATSANLEALVSRAHVGAPLMFRIFSGIGSFASTVLLATLGYAWTEIRDEWKDLKSAISEIRHELDQQPSPAEFEKLRDRVEQINERLIRMESRFDE